MSNFSATLDAQVVDFGCVDYFGIAEVKCLYAKYHVIPLDACTDVKFFMEQTGASECKLKEKPPLLCPCLGTYGRSKEVWLYFFFFTRKGIYVQYILFDPVFWAGPEQKLLSYYFEHFITFASTKLFIVRQITTVIVKYCAQLHLVDSVIYSSPAKSI